MQPGMAQSHKPRLLIYILTDCSGGMLRRMSLVRRCVSDIVELIERDPRSEVVYVSVIVFNDAASRTPLTPIGKFQAPSMEAIGKTQLGLALKALNEALAADLVPDLAPTEDATTFIDYRPLIFLISDGDPSSPEKVDWLEQAQILHQCALKPWHVVGIAIGPNPKVEVLEQIADVIIRAPEDTEQLQQALVDLIDWRRTAND